MPSDLRRILSEIQVTQRHIHLYDIFLFAVATGVRRDELCHLCHRDVYLDPIPDGLDFPVTGRIRVHCWDHPYTGKHFRTKNGKDRTIPLTPLAARIADRHLRSFVTEDDYAPVFQAVKGKRIQRMHLTRYFKHYREEAGLPNNLTFHSLRHVFASYLLMLGANVLTIKRILGHSTLAELDTYAELAEEYLMGDARSLQREMLLLLCPDLPDEILDRVLPSRRSLLDVLSGQKGSRAQHLQAIIPIEDVLFSGLVYEVGHTPSLLESF